MLLKSLLLLHELLEKKKKKTRKNSLDAVACDALKMIAETMKEKYSTSNSSASKNMSTGVLECQKILAEMQVDKYTYNCALRQFMNDTRWCDLFISMEDFRRADWLCDFTGQQDPPPPSSWL